MVGVGLPLNLRRIDFASAAHPYSVAQSIGDGVTKDQIRGEHDRLQGLLEAYEARAVADSIPDHHAGLRQRIAGLAMKLATTNVA